MPHAQSSFQDVDAVAVLFKNGMFEPLWFSNDVEEQNEKRSANPLIPKEFQIFEAVPSDHLQN